MSPEKESALLLSHQQRSHTLLVLSHPKDGQQSAFLSWYQGPFRTDCLRLPGILSAQHYEPHEVDITRGRYPPLPFRYLALCQISVDGAQAAEAIIEGIERLHRQAGTAEAPATWLYYPASEKVGRVPSGSPSMLTLAFANPAAGQEAEFREWYATRHIRHALNITALVSGQCFLRTQFQRPGALEALFHTIAVYEQEGPPESIIASFASLPEGTFHFPSLDTVRFAEWVYRPL